MYDSMQSSPQIIKSAHFKVQSLQVSLFVYVDHKYPFFVTKWWPKTKSVRLNSKRKQGLNKHTEQFSKCSRNYSSALYKSCETIPIKVSIISFYTELS